MIRPGQWTRWTPEEDEALIALSDLPVAEQARALGRTHGQVSSRRQLLRAAGRIPPGVAGRPWTPEEEQLVLDLIDQPLAVIAERLGRSAGAVSFKRHILRERRPGVARTIGRDNA